jgi:hypothetical protein
LRPLPFQSAALAAIALSAATGPALAGAWTEGAGQGRAILTLRGSTADDYFDHDGDRHSGADFSKQDADVYTTYGVTDATTILLQTAYSHLAPGAPATDQYGFDETQIGVQQRVWRDADRVLSLQASALLPGDSDLTSNGTDLELRGLFGQSFRMLRRQSFVDAQIAYRWRANGFADQFRADFTLGVWIDSNVMLLAQNFNTFTTTSGASQLFEGEQQKVQLSGVYRVSDQIALQLGGFATLGGRDTVADQGLLASFWLDY